MMRIVLIPLAVMLLLTLMVEVILTLLVMSLSTRGMVAEVSTVMTLLTQAPMVVAMLG